MIDAEVKSMENQEQKESGDQERPAWQVWAARFGLVIFLVFVIYQYLCVLRGGL